MDRTELTNQANRLCPSCMEMHEAQTVKVQETNIINGIEIAYEATYEYCVNTDEYYATEQQIRMNDIAQKDAYRKAKGLLSSSEIADIRKKYHISQADLSELLGWGKKTITRYESYQVQDVAYDDILRKLNEDPQWFLELLDRAKGRLRPDAYLKYKNTGYQLYSQNQEMYRRNGIASAQALYGEGGFSHGNVPLEFEKIVDVVNYFASMKSVTSLYLVKLMKLMWYADFLCYKRYGKSITGLAYQSLPMGAVPAGYKQMMELDGIEYEEVQFTDNIGYCFTCSENYIPRKLSSNEVGVLDTVIREFGSLSKDEIVSRMHNEYAFLQTQPTDVISYTYALNLSID